MSNGKTSLGKISLWTSIVGFVVPVGLAVFVVVRYWRAPKNAVLTSLVACLALFVVLEVAAFVCRIRARHTTTGKVGLAISGVLLLLALGSTVLLFWG
jgi:hypothetical protein